MEVSDFELRRGSKDDWFSLRMWPVDDDVSSVLYVEVSSGQRINGRPHDRYFPFGLTREEAKALAAYLREVLG
jgi:hypothetical protein